MADIPQTADFVGARQPTMPAHRRQFARFVHILKWFAVHVLLMLPGLYFLVIEGQPVAGMLFVVLGVAALVYGVLSTGTVARDVARAVDHQPDVS